MTQSEIRKEMDLLDKAKVTDLLFSIHKGDGEDYKFIIGITPKWYWEKHKCFSDYGMNGEDIWDALVEEAGLDSLDESCYGYEIDGKLSLNQLKGKLEKLGLTYNQEMTDLSVSCGTYM